MIARKSSNLHFVLLKFFKVGNPDFFISVSFFVKFHEGWDIWVENRDFLGGMTSFILESCCGEKFLSEGEKFLSDVYSLAESEDSIEGINSMLIECKMNVFLPSSGIHFLHFSIVFQLYFALYDRTLYQMELFSHKIMNIFSFLFIQFLLNKNLPCWHFLSTLKMLVKLWDLLSRLLTESFNHFFLKLLFNLKIGLVSDFGKVIKRRFLGQCDNFLRFIDLIDDEIWEKVLSNGWNLPSWR